MHLSKINDIAYCGKSTFGIVHITGEDCVLTHTHPPPFQAGDQLIEVDGKSLVGLSQERAAEHMKCTGHTVTLKVIKQGAIYHGLATLLSQPSPTMSRSSPTGGPPGKPRPVSEDVSRFGGPPRHGQEDPVMQKPLNMQHGAQSSPALAPGRGQVSVIKILVISLQIDLAHLSIRLMQFFRNGL